LIFFHIIFLVNENLAETAHTVFVNTFINNTDKANWAKSCFSEYIKFSTGGDWGKEYKTGNYDKEVLCIRGTDIPNLNIGQIEAAPIRYILNKNYEVKKVKPNDIIVEISGGSPTQSTGRIAFVSDKVYQHINSDIICSNFCRTLTIKEDYLYFFISYWNYLYRNGRMFDYENSSTGLKNFNFSSFVTEEEISVPPISTINCFSAIYKSLLDKIVENGFEIEALINTQKHILPRLMLNN